MPKKATAPVQALIPAEIAIDPFQPVTVTAPDTTALAQQFNEVMLPIWRKYHGQTIQSPEDYVQWNRDWSTLKGFTKSVETIFTAPCSEAFEAHRRLTGLRNLIMSYPNEGALMIGNEILRYQREEERKRIEAERAEQARMAAEHAEQVRQAEAAAAAERQRLDAERQAALEAVPEWERDEEPAPIPEVAVVVPVVPPPAPVRLPSTIPVVMGGPRVADKPYEAVITDPVALLKWVLENPAERIPITIEWKTGARDFLTIKCREHETRIANLIPGIEARRGGDSEFGQTLKKG